MKELIQKFLNAFAIRATDGEDPAITELMMDDHKYIEYEGQGYYLPENNSMFTEDDELLNDFLVYTYQT